LADPSVRGNALRFLLHLVADLSHSGHRRSAAIGRSASRGGAEGGVSLTTAVKAVF
jgi:hypothetical protein